MSKLLNIFRRCISRKARSSHRDLGSERKLTYESRLSAEKDIYRDVLDVNALPEIFHYWSNKFLRPMLEQFGVSNPDQFFAKYILESIRGIENTNPRIISIGAGNCDTEVRVAKLLAETGLDNFVIECLDINAEMLRRGEQLAEAEAVGRHIVPIEADFNRWRPAAKYSAVIANQSLHHVESLSNLFDSVHAALAPGSLFIVSDMIGRNGHQRWPEALELVHHFWRKLPQDYRYNHQLRRHEELYINWDCSHEGFEGIHAQDILPYLIERFGFQVFIAFANVIDVFIDRSFGHNFSIERAWDCSFIDEVHAIDEAYLKSGHLTPTHMMAVMTTDRNVSAVCSRGISPERSVRWPSG